MHVSRMADVAARRVARVVGGSATASPARSQVLADIEAGIARQHAEARSRWAVPPQTVLPSGRVVPRVEIPILLPGTYPEEWLD